MSYELHGYKDRIKPPNVIMVDKEISKHKQSQSFRL